MIEFQYFQECPNAATTLSNLKELISEAFIDESDIVMVEVPSPDSAEKANFQGSPTILHNGVDIFTGSEPEGFSFNCRIYEIDGKKTGVLSVDFIKSRISEFTKRTSHSS
jgi:hypothetical protein